MNNKLFFNDYKSDSCYVMAVSKIDISAISLLFENCTKCANVTNGNVAIATLSLDTWFDKIIDVILDNVDFISKYSNFQLYSIDNNTISNTTYVTEYSKFETIEMVISFIEEKSKFNIFVVYSIVCYVDLLTLKYDWVIRYKEIQSTSSVRDNKIEYLIK